MSVDASAQLHQIAARLRAAGERELRLQLLRGLKIGAAPLIPAVKNAAMSKLPKHGGLNRQVAGQRVTVSVRTGAKTANVRLTTTAPDTAQTDAGFVRHPVHGNRKRWIHQPIPAAAGWWSGTLAQSAPLVQPALLSTMETVAREIQG